MTTNEIITKIYNDQLEKKLSKKAISLVIANFIDYMRKDLAKGNRVSIVGLGSFTKVEKPEMVKRLPNGNSVKVPAHKAAKFKASKMLNDALNGGE
jgi:DNA-binding protein HU-beta